MIRHILVAHDFSPVSRRAVEFGLRLAERLDAGVTILTVLDVNDLRVAMKAGLHHFESDEEVRRKVDQWVDRHYRNIEKATNVAFRRVILRGIAEGAIVAEAKRQKADLIVMGSTGIARRIQIGSCAKAVLRRSPVPVAIITTRTRRRS